MKTCTKCGVEKAFEAFFKRGDRDGYRSHCRDCLRRDDGDRARRRQIRAERVTSSLSGVRHNMIQRCHNPGLPGFAAYGARGIYVCDRWRESLASFIADMGPRPSAHHSIERIDNDGPYSPENCRWATRTEQNRNTRQNVPLTVGGVTKCLAEWAAEVGLSESTLHSRIKRGWDHERAVRQPADITKRPRRAA